MKRKKSRRTMKRRLCTPNRMIDRSEHKPRLFQQRKRMLLKTRLRERESVEIRYNLRAEEVKKGLPSVAEKADL